MTAAPRPLRPITRTGSSYTLRLVAARKLRRSQRPPVRDVWRQAYWVAVLVVCRPVRMTELVNVEAMPQCLGEAHCVAGRVDRILDQQRGHRWPFCDATRKLQRLVREFGAGEDLRHHAKLMRFVGVDRITGQQKLFGLARTEFPWVGVVF